MIQLKDVSFVYEGMREPSVRHVTITIPDGECIVLCGASGCGKTTITRLLNGLIPNYYSGILDGEILWNQSDMSSMQMYEIAKIAGSLFQNPRTQFFNQDVESEIAFGLENTGAPEVYLRKRVALTMKELGLTQLQNSSLHHLSGGEKQRVAFASIYAMNPDVYLLDEPSSNLDMQAIHALHDDLSLIKKQGKTIVIAEHHLSYLMDLADRFVYMEHGEIKGMFTPDELKRISLSEREQMGLRAIDLKECLHAASIPPSLEHCLLLNNVSLYYKKRSILKHITLRAGMGEIIGIAGRNGAGKTTFSRAICGLHKEVDGQMIWNGNRLHGKDCLHLSYMVMQDVNYELFGDSVLAECQLGIRHPDNQQILAVLDKLKLSTCLQRHPNTLSGGQKQRLAVAVSMVCKKRILVFDEPTSGLDFESMIKVSDLLHQLSKQGNIVFIVTHDLEFLARVCTRVLYIDQQALVYDSQMSSATLQYVYHKINEENENEKETIDSFAASMGR